MSSEIEESDETPRILHCFADYGTESETLTNFGRVIRVGIDVRDTNESIPIRADAHVAKEDCEQEFPFADNVTFDLGVFHPVCSRWADTTSISGDPNEHENMIPSARKIGKEYCDHYVVENVPKAPLNDPIVLDGRMFGLPIKYERAFETTFHVPQPPRHKRFWHSDGKQENAETSSFFFFGTRERVVGLGKGISSRPISEATLGEELHSEPLHPPHLPCVVEGL